LKTEPGRAAQRSVGALAAIVYAILDITGRRVRDLPVTPDELL
jgi:CO/xanthine dehydrogenase Mo-binding subunit